MPLVTGRKLLAIAGIATLAVVSLSDPTARFRTPAQQPAEEPRELSAYDLASTDAKYTLLCESGQLVVASAYGRTRYELDLSIDVDGSERPLTFTKGGVVVHHDAPSPSLTAPFTIPFGEKKGRLDGTLDLRVDETTGALSVTVRLAEPPEKRPLELHLSNPAGSSVLFILGHGEMRDLGEVETHGVVIDDDLHPVAIAARDGRSFMFGQNAPEVEATGARPRVTTSLSLDELHAEVSIFVGASTDTFWGAFYEKLLRVPVANVKGTIEDTTGRAEVLALDEEGHPLLRVPASAGRFVVDAPRTAVRWYASIESTHSSTGVTDYVPDPDKELRLRMLPGGELRVRVLDGDTGLPVLARIAVRGIDGAIDPKFRHDFRSAGAGPLVDARSGEMKATLPAGRYRVSAIKGIEWSVDTKVIDMASGIGQTVELRPRHVIPTPNLVGCDLHVHARPSFDTSVLPEHRLLSLASAGIDFAIPTEHNIVGDYGPFVDKVDLRNHISHVTGVEVTTQKPAIGHFGLFPYSKEAPVPPYRNQTSAKIFDAMHRGGPSSVLVVHHPRLMGGLGYFAHAQLDPKSGKLPAGMRTDFDLVEVYSGYEIGRRSTVEAVMRDWFALLDLGKRYAATGSSDSHKLQFHWAGYPRTYVRLDDPAEAGDMGQPPNPNAVVGAIKRGDGFVSSGPILDFEVSGVRPGGDLVMSTWTDRKVPAHLRVRAAPWIDVTSIEVIAGSTSIFKASVPSRKTVTGVEHGSYEEATARTVRYDQDFSLQIPKDAKWVIVIVRGERPYDDVLPFMPVQPLAFTNPIWLLP